MWRFYCQQQQREASNKRKKDCGVEIRGCIFELNLTSYRWILCDTGGLFLNVCLFWRVILLLNERPVRLHKAHYNAETEICRGKSSLIVFPFLFEIMVPGFRSTKLKVHSNPYRENENKLSTGKRNCTRNFIGNIKGINPRKKKLSLKILLLAEG